MGFSPALGYLKSHLSLSWYLFHLSRSLFTLASPFLYQPPAVCFCSPCSPCRVVVSFGCSRSVTVWPPSFEKIFQDVSVLSCNSEPKHFSRLCGKPQAVILRLYADLNTSIFRSSEIIGHLLLGSRDSPCFDNFENHQKYTLGPFVATPENTKSDVKSVLIDRF